jgi:hypothetical protein
MQRHCVTGHAMRLHVHLKKTQKEPNNNAAAVVRQLRRGQGGPTAGIARSAARGLPGASRGMGAGPGPGGRSEASTGGWASPGAGRAMARGCQEGRWHACGAVILV